VVVRLTELEYELHEICESLPIASDQGAMEDECVATDVPMWLRSTLHQVKHKPVRQAIERLREAAQRTEDDQRYALLRGDVVMMATKSQSPQNIDSEVAEQVEKARRRRFSAAYKLKILEAVGGCSEPPRSDGQYLTSISQRCPLEYSPWKKMLNSRSC
jgi:hypothetical protein